MKKNGLMQRERPAGRESPVEEKVWVSDFMRLSGLRGVGRPLGCGLVKKKKNHTNSESY